MNELTEEQQQQVEELFDQALNTDAGSRRALLDSAGATPAVREEVESLLQFHPAASSKMDSPAVSPDALLDAVEEVVSRDELGGVPDPVTIGPYHIIEKLGEGGMGSVYLAQQEKPLRRRVALKLIKVGMDTRSVIARFDAERQALAMMDHPNVARAFDAGETAEGRPYFIMEYVDGPRVTAYCDQERLDLNARLDIFMSICRGIQHAHQKGVIHRDIKPSNVLVCRDNGAAVPKVIDFGVAKATNQRLTEQTLFTEQGVMIGTPEYMSPEQAGSCGDVDTRTDVYSLGVLLYELLVGALPLDGESLRGASLDEIHRRIREEDPPKPTAHLSGSSAAAEETARKRGTDLSTLRRKISGDLEWIVMKCLDKDRERRYASAADLVGDIERCLRHEPVTAGPPSMSYRVRKYARRNRAMVIGAAAVFVALVAGIITSTAFAKRESRQRAIAEAQARTTQAINEFLNTMLASADPKTSRGRDDGLLREILDAAAAKVADELADQPRVESSVRRTIGQTYMNLGLYPDAAPHMERALAIEELLDDGPNADHAMALYLLGMLRDCQGRYDESETLLIDAIEVFREVLEPTDARLANGLNRIAIVLMRAGRLDHAKTYLDEAVGIVARAHAPDSAIARDVSSTLAGYHRNRGELAEAAALYRQHVATYAGTPDDPDALVQRHNLAIVLTSLGEFDESEELFLETLEASRRVYGPEHHFTVSVSNGLAMVLQRQGRNAESEVIQREVLAIHRRTLGEKHPDVQTALNNLATVLHAQGKLDESIALYRETLELAREIRGPDHPLLAMQLAQLGFVLRDKADPENYPEAETLILGAVEILEASLPKGHPYTLNTLRGLRRLYGEEAMNDPVKLAEVEARLEAKEPDLRRAAP